MKSRKIVAMRKPKRVSTIARGRLAKVLVLRGSKEKTAGGLTRDALMRNSRGKAVSKRASAHGKRSFRNIEPWVDSVMEARRALYMKGFVAINGKSLAGKALYIKSKALYSAHGRVGKASSSSQAGVGGASSA